ncbi:ammonium transporter 1-like, partial [Teratosphaeria destructans]
VVAGLVAITPGSGYVPAWAAVVYGVCAGVGCNFGTKLKYWIRADDALDIFAVHAIGAFVGSLVILTAISLLGRVCPVLRLRVDEAEEAMGIDDVEMGEYAYDYVELRREVKPPTTLHGHGPDGGEEEEMDDDATSHRSHSQAAMIDQKQAYGYPMRTMSREADYSYATPVGQAH